MFTDFKPARTLRESRDLLTDKRAILESRNAEVVHFAKILADAYVADIADDRMAADYLAARERWEEAARDLDDTRTKAVAENTVELLRLVTQKPGLTLVKGDVR